MEQHTDLAATANDVSESMVEVSELMADLSDSLEQAADGFTVFSETMARAADNLDDRPEFPRDSTAARSRSSGLAAADD